MRYVIQHNPEKKKNEKKIIAQYSTAQLDNNKTQFCLVLLEIFD